MSSIVPFKPLSPAASADPSLPADPSGLRPCEPLTAKQVWDVASEVFKSNDLQDAYKRAQRGYDSKHGCFWIRVSDVPSHVLEVCIGQIGDKLETDFTMAATEFQAGIRQYLISFNEIQNTNAEISDARAASIAEYHAQREKFRSFL